MYGPEFLGGWAGEKCTQERCELSHQTNWPWLNFTAYIRGKLLIWSPQWLSVSAIRLDWPLTYNALAKPKSNPTTYLKRALGKVHFSEIEPFLPWKWTLSPLPYSDYCLSLAWKELCSIFFPWMHSQSLSVPRLCIWVLARHTQNQSWLRESRRVSFCIH